MLRRYSCSKKVRCSPIANIIKIRGGDDENEYNKYDIIHIKEN